MSLRIDFAPSAGRKSSLRLGLGSAAMVLILSLAWVITSETEAGLPQSLVSQPAEEDIRMMNNAIDELNFPWLQILSLVEDSVDDTLRIIQFDANARDGRLSLHGEAKDSRVVLELPARLRASPVIEEARVISQNPAGNNETGNFPIRFALEVTFRATDRIQP
ncbi:MAG TPA: hypothetical protein VN303_11620 [Pseudomonas sp.]|nr:hypothetical protein [Pseudomonas sp.]